MREKVLLPDVVWFQEGPGVRNTQYTDSGVKLLNVANLIDGKIDLSNTNRFISNDEAYGRYKHFLVDEGDLIIASSGIKVEYFDKKMGFINQSHLPLCMNTSTIRFKTLDSTKLDIRYFMYFLKSDNFKLQLSKQITGSAQLNFGPSHLKKMNIPIIAIEEQRKIAAVLDKIDSLISRHCQQLEKLGLLVKSQFIEMFGEPETNSMGWEHGTIKDIVSDVRYGSSRKAVENGKYPYLRMNNITYEGELNLSDTKRINVPDDELPKCSVRRGDVLFNRTNSKELVGKTCLYNRDELMVLAGFVIRVRVNEKAIPEFLVTYMNLTQTKNLLLSMCRAACGQANINATEFQGIPIYIPPVDLQKQFAEFKQQAEQSKFVINQSLEKLETLKKSLMQDYFE